MARAPPGARCGCCARTSSSVPSSRCCRPGPRRSARSTARSSVFWRRSPCCRPAAAARRRSWSRSACCLLGAAGPHHRRVNQAHFHFFVMVAALSLYEDWVPFLIAVVYVLVQQGITAEIVDYDEQTRHGAGRSCTRCSSARCALVCLATGGRRSATGGVPLARRVARGGRADGRPRRAPGRGEPERGADPRHGAGAGAGRNGSDPDWSFVDDDGVPWPRTSGRCG